MCSNQASNHYNLIMLNKLEWFLSTFFKFSVDPKSVTKYKFVFNYSSFFTSLAHTILTLPLRYEAWGLKTFFSNPLVISIKWEISHTKRCVEPERDSRIATCRSFHLNTFVGGKVRSPTFGEGNQHNNQARWQIIKVKILISCFIELPRLKITQQAKTKEFRGELKGVKWISGNFLFPFFFWLEFWLTGVRKSIKATGEKLLLLNWRNFPMLLF